MANEMRQSLSARLGRSIAPFFQRIKSYFIQFITDQLPETGRIMPGFGFLRLPEGWWFDIEVLTTTRKHIFSRRVRCWRK